MTEHVGTSGDVRTLNFAVHVYRDHAFVTVALSKAFPTRLGTRRLGSVRLPLGSDVLAGLDSTAVVKLVAGSLVSVMSDLERTLPPAKRVGAPLGATGGAVEMGLDKQV